MRDRLVKFLATGFGAGLSPVAPGTVGSLVGIGYWILLMQLHSAWLRWLIVIAAIALAVWCAGEAADILRRPDPPSVVIDEIVAMPLVMIGVAPRFWPVALAFVLFRVFDVAKPPPVRQAQDFTGGLGIVLDDLLAAIYACGATHLTLWFVAWLRTRA